MSEINLVKSTPSIDITDYENWERFGKYFVLSIAFSFIITILLIIIAMIFGDGLIGSSLALLSIIATTMLLLSSYESWRGCKVHA